MPALVHIRSNQVKSRWTFAAVAVFIVGVGFLIVGTLLLHTRIAGRALSWDEADTARTSCEEEEAVPATSRGGERSVALARALRELSAAPTLALISPVEGSSTMSAAHGGMPDADEQIAVLVVRDESRASAWVPLPESAGVDVGIRGNAQE
jgi:hypothetical protein